MPGDHCSMQGKPLLDHFKLKTGATSHRHRRTPHLTTSSPKPVLVTQQSLQLASHQQLIQLSTMPGHNFHHPGVSHPCQSDLVTQQSLPPLATPSSPRPHEAPAPPGGDKSLDGSHSPCPTCGCVLGHVEGSPRAVEQFVAEMCRGGPPNSYTKSCQVHSSEALEK